LAGENLKRRGSQDRALVACGLYLVHLPVFLLVSRAGFGADAPMSLAKALISFTLQIGGAILLSACSPILRSALHSTARKGRPGSGKGFVSSTRR
jgi:hypothetical protein